MKILITITLSVLLVLALETSNAQHNKRPCMSTQNRYGYDNFKRNHILPDGFDPTKKDAFKAHIQSIGRQSTRVQTFIPYKHQGKVAMICNGRGKIQSNNLCMSDKRIPVHTVEVNTANYEIIRKSFHRQHVTVACDKVEGRCLPVHLEKNTSSYPHRNRRVCK